MRSPFTPIALALGLVAACSSSSKTALVVGVSTQARVPKDLRAVRVVARPSGAAPVCATFAIDGGAPLPQVVRVDGAAGQAASVDVFGVAQASNLPADPCAAPAAAKVVRRATTSFVDGEQLFVPAPLTHACFGVACPDGQTCDQGECRSAAVDPASLVRYDDALVYDTSFCLAPSQCFSGRLPALLLDRDACVFRLTGDVTIDRGINVEVLHDDLTREILDHDPDDGFTYDASAPDRFRLSPVLCRRWQARKIAAVLVGVGCPSKTALNPVCASDADAADPPDGGDVPDPPELCTVGADLAPSPSALYVLMDRSKSMRASFGDGGIGDELDLALQAPELRTSVVGFRFLPGAPADCAAAPDPFAAPAPPDGVAFAPAADAHAAVGALVRDASRVLSSDAPLYLDAALRGDGVFAALEAQPVARRALLVLAARDLTAHCTPSVGAVPDLASTAWHTLGGIQTSAILLPAAAGTSQGGRDPVVDGTAMTRAGVGTFVDGSFDPGQVEGGIVATVAELGMCLYDLPQEIDASGDVSTTMLSYFDFLAQKRVDVAQNAACSGAPSSAPQDGWNLDGGRVRLCGKPCNDLRYMFTLGAIYALEHHAPPPDVAMKWSPRCR